ncbi:hypothetical protein EDEG_03747 [Edhazardia aedis USNM 41457]|uniref:Uncharacterized protein n=1 Tax=Edhazardia aedis (strain USNM 41457) TaxID=1003232 RepID=J9D1L4_EDHAE|nr:hypothetical protein EDEG_03747 [Edhazardia aedis USNM 41457]|eukprot:EJW01731.1 hypothetical protein EDEG_03747 [Edhazardia aedis USNM 41457]
MSNFNLLNFLKIRIFANARTLLFSGILCFIIRNSYPYKITRTSSMNNQDTSLQMTKSPFLVSLEDNVIPYSKHSSFPSLENLANSSDQNNHNPYKEVKEMNPKIESSFVKRSIGDGKLSLEDLKLSLSNDKMAILDNNRIIDLFNLLTTQVDNYKEEFMLKGELYQLIYNHEVLRKLYERYLRGEMNDFQADNVIDFYFKWLFSCKSLNENYFEGKIVKDLYDYEKDEESLKYRRLISPNRDFLNENSVYIKNFNKMFGLFWQHNFKRIQDIKEFLEEDEDKSDIYRMNIDMWYEYDYNDIRYEVVTNEKIMIDENNSKDSITIKIVNTTYRNRDFLLNATSSLGSSLNAFLEVCGKSIDFEKMYEIVKGVKILTNYGMDVLENLSLFVREEIYKKLGGNLDNSIMTRVVGMKDKDFLRSSSTSGIKNPQLTNTIFIQVQNWATRSKCEQVENAYECGPNMNVFIGLIVDED